MSGNKILNEIPVFEKRISLNFFITALIGIFLILPCFILKSRGNGIIALAFLGFCAFIVGIILGFKYFLKTQRIVSLVNTETPLAIWNYDPGFWNDFMKNNYLIKRKDTIENSKHGSYIITFFTIIGLIIFIFLGKLYAGITFLILMFFLISLVFLTGFLLSYLPYKRGLKSLRVIIITKKFLYFNSRFYLFNDFNSKLTHVGYYKKNKEILEFAIITHTYQAGNSNNSILIPVADDNKEDTKQLIEDLKIKS